MKKLSIVYVLIIYAVIVCGTAKAQSSPSESIPRIKTVDNKEAPIGAVIQLTLESPGLAEKDLKKFELQIGRQTVSDLTWLDELTVAAVIPPISLPPAASAAKAVPTTIIFFNEQNHGGDVYKNFSVILKTELSGRSVDISNVSQQANSQYFDIRFNDSIPPELWNRVTIYVDDRVVKKIIQMSPRLFSFEFPSSVPRASSHVVFVTVGGTSSSTRSFRFYEPTPTPTPNPTPTTAGVESPGSSNWTVFSLIGIVIALITLSLSLYIYLRTKRLEKINAKPLLPEDVEELHLPEEVPADLVDACAGAECVLYAGAGLSAQSGLPTWSDFVQGLLTWALESKFINKTEADSYSVEVARGQADPVADSIVSRLTTEDRQSALNNYLRKVFLKRSSPSALHSQLKRIKFSAVLTTNFDNLLEGIYEVNKDQVFTPRDTEQLLSSLTRRAFFVLKLYGTLERDDTVMVAPAQYEDAITDNTLFSEFMQTLFFSRTLLFVGASLEGIEAYLRGITLPKDVARGHYALVAVTDRAWRAKAELLERRYGIKVLPYTPRDNHAELSEFLNKLTESVAARQDMNTGAKQQVSRLKRVTLENIGAFENLTLEFDLRFRHKWHVFLGDNGVGKSTVLRAIALALCGKEAQPYAGRLLRDRKKGDKVSLAKKTVGTITLETDNKTSYVTTIQRDDKTGQVEIISTTARPLEAEGWLALGFPPLRTTSWEAPKGPDADIKIKSRPVVSDLLPLVTGEVDPRLDKLKQWIVNLDYLDIKSKGPEGNYRSLIQKVFDIIGSVAEGMKLTYKGVGEGNRVLGETDDGTLIPLEALSQGTISMIGWIGILMQRLYEVFGQDEDPTQRYALILMDEIDAHMHPLWQRTLISHLMDEFPNAQFIASTHSPLVVAGLPAGQVVRFARDSAGRAVILPMAQDVTFGYADQILTSDLFNLPTTLGVPAEKKMERYSELDQMNDRGDYEAEHELLRRELMAQVPPRSGSYKERHDEMLSKALLLKDAGEKLGELSPEGSETILARANHLLSSLSKGEKNDPS